MTSFQLRERASAYETLAKTLERAAKDGPDRLAIHLIGAAYSLKDAVKELAEMADDADE